MNLDVLDRDAVAQVVREMDQRVAKESPKKEDNTHKISTTSRKLGVHTDPTSLKETVHARCLHQYKCAVMTHDPVAP